MKQVRKYIFNSVKLLKMLIRCKRIFADDSSKHCRNGRWLNFLTTEWETPMKKLPITVMACSIALCSALALTSNQVLASGKKSKTAKFQLVVDPAMANCLSDGSGKKPSAKAVIIPGKVNDTLVLTLRNVKPKLAFDLFTVEHSNLDSTGVAATGFTDFGLAWYQSDITSDRRGKSSVIVKTILLNQAFGFDAGKALDPTNTFHLGIWFNDPKDAAACGFDVTKPTPFNGEHKAGPLAMITVPNATTGLGPLCTKPVIPPTPATPGAPVPAATCAP